jgi:hypothetical protein
MAERLKAHAWKACEWRELLRGFESLSLRQNFQFELYYLSKIEDAKKFIEGYAIQIDIIFKKDCEIFISLIKKLIILKDCNN